MTSRTIAPTRLRSDTAGERIALPAPCLDGVLSLEAALAGRRSVRELGGPALTIGEIGQLLWAAQGVTGPEGRRTAPSAGATHALELYAVTADGVFRYLPDDHALAPIAGIDVRSSLQAAADQAVVGDAPLVLVVTAVPARTEARFGARAARYVALEAGHAAQNLLLATVSLGLGAVPVGSFDAARVADLLGLAAGEEALYLLPVGRPR